VTGGRWAVLSLLSFEIDQSKCKERTGYRHSVVQNEGRAHGSDGHSHSLSLLYMLLRLLVMVNVGVSCGMVKVLCNQGDGECWMHTRVWEHIVWRAAHSIGRHCHIRQYVTVHCTARAADRGHAQATGCIVSIEAFSSMLQALKFFEERLARESGLRSTC
jgi:hypothetical protein